MAEHRNNRTSLCHTPPVQTGVQKKLKNTPFFFLDSRLCTSTSLSTRGNDKAIV